MSRVLVKGNVGRMKGPWQYDCPNCRSVVELTIDSKAFSKFGLAYWLCPGCGAALGEYDVTKGER